MKTYSELSVAGILALLGLSSVWFAHGYLQGGSRVGFVASYMGFVAVGAFALAALLPRVKLALLVGTVCGLLGPAIALGLIWAYEGGVLHPDGSVFRRLVRVMAILWLPGNLVSSLLGMPGRLSHPDISRRAELYEWLRLVPLNVVVYALLAAGVQLLRRSRQRAHGQ